MEAGSETDPTILQQKNKKINPFLPGFPEHKRAEG